MNVKIGDFIKVVEGSDKSSLKEGTIYRIIEWDWDKRVRCPFCSCFEPTIIVCSSNGLAKYLACGCKIELYKGSIKNTLCYDCKDKLFCTISLGVKIEI